MTTKPRHTTTRKRHGADVRHNQRQAQADQVERELRDALTAHYAAAQPGLPLEHRLGGPRPAG